MSSRRSHFSSEDDRVSSRTSSRVQPRTFEFEEEEEDTETVRSPRNQTGPNGRNAFTGPHSPVHSREPPVEYIEEYTTTYTKIVRSTEHLDSIPKDPEPLRFPDDFNRVDDGRPQSFAFEDLDKDSSLHGFGSDRFDFGSSNGSPKRSKSLSSFPDIDDEDYGFVAVPYAKSPAPANRINDQAGRASTRGGKVLKSIERWETESYSTNGQLYRSTSEKVLNGVDHPSKRDVEDIAALRAQSLRDLSHKFSPDARGVTVQSASELESTPSRGWEGSTPGRGWEDRIDGLYRQQSNETWLG